MVHYTIKTVVLMSYLRIITGCIILFTAIMCAKIGLAQDQIVVKLWFPAHLQAVVYQLEESQDLGEHWNKQKMYLPKNVCIQNRCVISYSPKKPLLNLYRIAALSKDYHLVGYTAVVWHCGYCNMKSL